MKRLLFSTILSATLMFAQMGPPPEGGPRGPRENQMEALKAALELDDAQVQELVAIRGRLREQIKPLIEQQQALREQVKEGIQDPAVSDAEIGALVRRQDAIRTQIQEAHQAADEAAVALINGWGRGVQLEALQEAAEKQPAVGQAMRLGLLERPEGAMQPQARMGRSGRKPMMGPGPRP